MSVVPTTDPARSARPLMPMGPSLGSTHAALGAPGNPAREGLRRNEQHPHATLSTPSKQLSVAGAAQVFDEQGRLVDPTVRKLTAQFIEEFADFVARRSDARTRHLERRPVGEPHR